jgi:glycosyltransferase involved in cell wall biosynthesis
MKPCVVICRSNPIAPDPRVEKEAHALSEAGYEVRLLGWDRSASLPRDDRLDGMRVSRLPIRAEYASGMRNLPDLLRWQWGLLQWLVRHRKEYDLIHACDFDTVLPALLCRSLYGKQVVYDIFDFYADHLRLTPTWIKDAIRAVDLRAIGWADALILVDDSRREQIRGSKPQRCAVVYNSPQDIQVASGPDRQKVQIADHKNSSLHIAYIGLLQGERGLFELLAVLRQHPEWSLDLAGFGGDEDRIVELARDMPNVRWHGRIPYQSAIQLSAAADVLIATYDPSIPNHRYSSPNKVFEAMLLGKPIIVAQDTNMDRIIQQSDCGLIVPYGDATALEASLLRLQTDLQLRRRLGENARKAYDTTYSWKIMQDRLLGIYQQVAG